MKSAPLIRLAIQGNATPMQRHQPAGYAETQTNPIPVLSWRIGFDKRLKNPFLQFQRDSWTGIGHPDMNVGKLGFSSQDYLSAIGEL